MPVVSLQEVHARPARPKDAEGPKSALVPLERLSLPRWHLLPLLRSFFSARCCD